MWAEGDTHGPRGPGHRYTGLGVTDGRFGPQSGPPLRPAWDEPNSAGSFSPAKCYFVMATHGAQQERILPNSEDGSA
ncbi:hypothetical protein EYF80_005769 [Liparis tanakae]|uniref:Uncharacterized protein n=1 Tax=Liparis tanakae TaxID=230148 RepID=A0A4Z2J2F0_9TELE|nr:hypothetical protein EYF80_005769 [Liparis tanakae]